MTFPTAQPRRLIDREMSPADQEDAMTTQAATAPTTGFSMKKWILKLLFMGFVIVTMIYAKTIGIFVKVFVKELFSGGAKKE